MRARQRWITRRCLAVCRRTTSRNVNFNDTFLRRRGPAERSVMKATRARDVSNLKYVFLFSKARDTSLKTAPHMTASGPRFFLPFFLFDVSYRTIFEIKRPGFGFYLRSLQRMILRKYSRSRVSIPVPRGRIKLTFIHRREIPGYHNSEVRERPARAGRYSALCKIRRSSCRFY